MLRTLLLSLLLLLTNTGSVYALGGTNLKLQIEPLGCITDTVDDGLNIYQYDSSPLCNPPETTPETPSTPVNVDKVPDITYLPKQSNNTDVLRSAPDNSSLNVTYHAALQSSIIRQSVVHKLAAFVGTMTLASLIALFLRFL